MFQTTEPGPANSVLVSGQQSQGDVALLPERRHRRTAIATFIKRVLRARRRLACDGLALRPGQLDLDALAPDWQEVAIPSGPRAAAATVRRALDVALSLAALIILLPVLGVIAALVRLDSPGPALYRQERIGLSGQPFTLLKFRSMQLDAEAAGPCWAAQHDPRVTRLGRVLRRARLDELPQLFCVLAGSMSLVGPRPERPHFAAQLAPALPHFALRTLVKPGITGWAQINYPYGASVADARHKLAYDLFYIQHRSVLLDVRIMLATLGIMLRGKGAR